jgi:hypothetical protein
VHSSLQTPREANVTGLSSSSLSSSSVACLFFGDGGGRFRSLSSLRSLSVSDIFSSCVCGRQKNEAQVQLFEKMDHDESEK